MNEIYKYDIVKYLKCIYLVKDFHKLENGRYRLNYYFRTSKNDKVDLKMNDFYDFYSSDVEKIKKPTLEERNFLISRIKVKYPNFDLSFIKNVESKNIMDLNENDCIDFLKNKGYLIYKQVK